MRPVTLLLLCCVFAISAVAAERITVCRLAADPHRYVTQQVTVVGARVFDNGVDVSELRDASCPSAFIDLNWTVDPAKLQRLETLRSALFREGGIGTMGKEIRGDFTGRVKVGRSLAKDVAVLVLEGVENLEVKFTQPSASGQ